MAVAAATFAWAAGVASAQGAKRVAFATTFSFILNGKEMPAGRYELEAQPGLGAAQLVLYNAETKEKTIAKVITRLADLGGTEPKIVFDKTADAQYLAEVHIPGMDGFDVQHAPGEHSHTRVVAQP